ncbi:MAG: alpha/beta hydrolase [Phototrophicales bacterium]
MLELLRYIPQTPHPTPLLFIHGAWHGAWCWAEYFLPYFEQQGFAAYALSLRGHGNSTPQKLRWVSIWDYVADVRQQVEIIEQEAQHPPVLIGHSMGGYIVQKYLERYDAPAGVLLASIPVMGTLPFFSRFFRRYPLAFLKSGLLMKGYSLVEDVERAHALFFSAHMPFEQVKQYHTKIQDESFRLVFDSALLNRPNPKRVKPAPMQVLAAANDQIFSVKEQMTTAKAYHTEAVVLADTAHDVMLEPNWQVAADHILMFIHNLPT